jgi:hypothetical protein
LAKNIEETWPRTSKKLGQNFEGIFEVFSQVLQSSWKSSSKFLAKFFDDANFPGSPLLYVDSFVSVIERVYLILPFIIYGIIAASEQTNAASKTLSTVVSNVGEAEPAVCPIPAPIRCPFTIPGAVALGDEVPCS